MAMKGIRNGRDGQDKTKALRQPTACSALGGLVLTAILATGGRADAEVLSVSRTVSGTISGDARQQVLRQITDPCLGLHWRLVVDPAHPGWPGRMILLDQNAKDTRAKDMGGHASSAGSPAASNDRSGGPENTPAAGLVIRAGDPVMVEQDSGVLHARFQSFALESAATGQPLRVRLIVNSDPRLRANSALTSRGPVISAVAMGTGRAAWPANSSIRPEAAEPATDRNQR
jgi:hypothetical protein